MFFKFLLKDLANKTTPFPMKLCFKESLACIRANPAGTAKALHDKRSLCLGKVQQDDGPTSEPGT
jgi:hypothetical protein